MRLVICAVLAISACDADPPPYERGVSCEVEIAPGRPERSREMDLILAISDAPTMAAYHDRLLDNLPTFAHVLETLEGGLPSLRVAVVGVHGTLIDARLPWFVCDAGACRERNYDGAFDAALTAFGDVQPTSDGSTAILQRILDVDLRTFHRPGAYLGVLIITADDDTSGAPVAAYIDALRNQLTDPGLLIVGIAGPDDAPRLDEVAAALPNRNSWTAIDGDDWSGALPVLAQLLAPADGRCIMGVLDEDELASCEAMPDLPRCTMAAPDRPAVDTPLPCWWVLDQFDDDWCPQLMFVESASSPYPAPVLRCPCP